MKNVIMPILSIDELTMTSFERALKEYELCMGRKYTCDEFGELAKDWEFLPNGMIYTTKLYSILK